ncbi:hypothetical protein V6N12_016941 [Hibiscus sabdariffa]|uniref:Uncharacterized protein n=1 Tax=Hibiscus sabdariffa TaxID=183260 RepID=A0ABR2AV52_9ROSI
MEKKREKKRKKGEGFILLIKSVRFMCHPNWNRPSSQCPGSCPRRICARLAKATQLLGSVDPWPGSPDPAEEEEKSWVFWDSSPVSWA